MPKVKPALERLPVLVEAQGEMRVDRQDPHEKRKCELENGDDDRGGPDASQQRCRARFSVPVSDSRSITVTGA